MQRTLAAFFLCFVIVAGAKANQVSYQGILTNSGGDTLLSGMYDFSFSIFSSETGGTARWTEAHADVEVDNGVYSVILGSTTPLPDSIGATNWLQITVEGTVLTPRLPIMADFRAIESRHAENSDSVNHIPACATPQPGHLIPLDNTGHFPETVLPFTLDSILAGQGLTGSVALQDGERRGRNSLDERLTINVGAGDGISVSADQVAATLGTSISTAEIENNAVTSAKVLDNTLTTADIAPDIVSSLDSVFNDGGNIDLIAGQNITIVPDDSANTITFSAVAATYQEGRCIEINGNTIDNIMDIFGSNCINVNYDPLTCSYDVYLDMDIEGDDCISVDYDSATCTYELSSLLQLIGGECVTVERGLEGCNWTISIDPECLQGGEQDSTFDSEVYARSFVVTPDGTLENAVGHLTSDGKLELYGAGGDTMRINPNGTWNAIQDSVAVAGLQDNGEIFAKSFEVRDSAGGPVKIHLANDGEIYVGENGHRIRISKNHISAYNQDTDSWTTIDRGGVTVTDSNETHGAAIDQLGLSTGDTALNGVDINNNGTWDAYRGGVKIAALDSTGEIIAKSFQVRDSVSGALKAHLDNDGNLALPSGAQVTVGGVPIAGGEGDTIRRGSGNDSTILHSNGLEMWDLFDTTKVNQGGVFIWDGFDTLTARPDTFLMGKRNGDSKVVIRSDGCLDTWHDTTKVAGIDINGEVYGQSFYTVGNAGDTIAHLDHAGNLSLPDGAEITIGGIPISGEGDQVIRTDSNSYAALDANGLSTGTDSLNGIIINPDGTWESEQNGVFVAGVTDDGEIHAKSFEVRDSLSGELKAHLANNGDLELPDGAQITIGGVPIGGDIGNEIEFDLLGATTRVNGGGVFVDDEITTNYTEIGPLGVVTGNEDNNSEFHLDPKGTWSAEQNGVVVAGLDTTGEIHAKSFEVRDSAGGDVLAHLYKNEGVGNLYVPGGTISASTVFASSLLYASILSGNTQHASDLSPTFIRTLLLINAVVTSGWSFLNNGTMTQYINGIANMQTTADGYWQFRMPVFFGEPSNFNYLTGGTIQQGIVTSGNMTVNGKLNVTGNVDPIISELFLTDSRHRYDVGTVLIADPNSDKYIPCTDAYQTSVVGVVSPETEVDENGYVLATILGAAASFKDDGSRLEVKIKADAKYGAIHRGDLLTTSATPGHAMLAADPKIGTIVGKALESLDNGTGEIKVMVTLQ